MSESLLATILVFFKLSCVVTAVIHDEWVMHTLSSLYRKNDTRAHEKDRTHTSWSWSGIRYEYASTYPSLSRPRQWGHPSLWFCQWITRIALSNFKPWPLPTHFILTTSTGICINTTTTVTSRAHWHEKEFEDSGRQKKNWICYAIEIEFKLDFKFEKKNCVNLWWVHALYDMMMCGYMYYKSGSLANNEYHDDDTEPSSVYSSSYFILYPSVIDKYLVVRCSAACVSPSR